MKVLLPTARGAERIASIPHLPKDTLIISNDPDFDIKLIPYPCRYSDAGGYWKAMNDVIAKFDWDEPFIWLADDIKPYEGWFKKIQECYTENFPNGFGLVVLNDLNLMHGGAAFAVITRKWLYVLFGESFFPDIFAHNFLDTVIANFSKDLGRYYFCQQAVVEHLHYSIGKSPFDEVYEANKKRARENQDAKVKNELDEQWFNGEIRHARRRLKNMKEKKAFFVLGSEGSGTHMMRNFLVDGGCYWEQVFEEADEDKLDFYNKPAPLVIRRSLPHAHKWPELDEIHKLLVDAGYNVFVIFTLRDYNASSRSVVRRDYAQKLDECYDNQYELFIHLTNYLREYITPERFVYSTYEAFVNYPGFRKWLMEERLKLPFPKDFQIFDGNKQYYGEKS